MVVIYYDRCAKTDQRSRCRQDDVDIENVLKLKNGRGAILLYFQSVLSTLIFYTKKVLLLAIIRVPKSSTAL